jgi:hypothetical protein
MIAMIVLVTAMIAAWAPTQSPAGEATAAKPNVQAAAKSRVRVTISKETTRITAPLRKDGYVDYVAALNEHFRAGVTVKNNAAVLFWQAMGPREINPQYREEYFKRLGIPPLAEKGNYYVPLNDYAKRGKDAGKPADAERQAKTMKQWDVAMSRPWSEKEFPILAGWLAANEKAISMVVEASKRPRRYDPLIAGKDGMVISVVLPALQQQREAARALKLRAMLRLNEGKVDKAWEDLLACHRLARLAGQGPTLIDALVAIAIDGVACAGDQRLLQHAQLTAGEIAKLRGDLDKLPPLSKMVDKIDHAERYMFLDCVSMVAREGLASMGKLADGNAEDSTIKSLISLAVGATIDWDQILRTGNTWYDRMADTFRTPTRPERQELRQKIDADLRKLAKSTSDLKSLALSMLGCPREALSQRLCQVFVALLLPAVSSVADAEDRATMQFDLIKLAFALAAYRADHGEYPARLADLATKYVAAVPKDIFNGEELRYKRKAEGYLLYSVGVNGKDDGGKGYDDRKPEETWDDLVVRVPAAAKASKKAE